MEKYDGLKLTPLFWSEISSSYLLKVILEEHDDIAKDFIKKFLGLSVDGAIKIDREQPLLDKGSIDLLVNFESKSINTYVLVEVKVHDYASATRGQINTYYSAALDKFKESDVYFIYLTQFNRSNFPDKGFELPMTIMEFEDGEKNAGKYKNRLKHVSWQEWNSFIKEYKGVFTKEEDIMLYLQETWVTAKCEDDLNKKKSNVGERDISHYFGGLYEKLISELNFGKTRDTQKRTILEIDLSRCSTDEFNKIFGVIKELSDSKNIDKNVTKNSEDLTLNAAREFLNRLVQDQSQWGLLSFYSSLFNLINEKKYLRLHGTGASGFSIKIRVKEKGEISLCTLWCSNKNIIEFALKR